MRFGTLDEHLTCAPSATRSHFTGGRGQPRTVMNWLTVTFLPLVSVMTTVTLLRAPSFNAESGALPDRPLDGTARPLTVNVADAIRSRRRALTVSFNGC